VHPYPNSRRPAAGGGTGAATAQALPEPEREPAASGREALAPGPAIVGAIPARYGSTRLPGKPLLPLAGRPMIEHVYRRVASARGLARIVVLTDDPRIARAVAAFGGEVELTPAECASGTDRIAHAARRWSGAAAVVNVQGDEPLIDPEAVSAIAEHLAAHPEDPVVTLAAPLAPAGPGGGTEAAAAARELADPNVVKVVVGRDGRALYFSRSAIPYARQEGGAAPLRHLGIYGYQRAALLALADLPPSPLERSEALEQLRALEHGMPIRVLVTAAGLPGVDTREDLERVERLLLAGAARAAGEN